MRSSMTASALWPGGACKLGGEDIVSKRPVTLQIRPLSTFGEGQEPEGAGREARGSGRMAMTVPGNGVKWHAM